MNIGYLISRQQKPPQPQPKNQPQLPPDDSYSFTDYGLSFKELKKELGGKPDKKSKNITKLYGEGAIADSDKTGMTTWEYYGNTTTMSYDFTKKKKCKIVVTNVKSGEDAAL